jgi:hypothetical protein
VTSEEEEKALLKKKYGAFYIAILVDMFLMDVENLNPSEISDNIGLVKLKSLFE